MVDINIKNIEDGTISLIDEGAKLERRSRSNFMLNSSIEKANKLIALNGELENEQDNK